MFKFEKALGAKDSVPEIISVPAPSGNPITAGFIYYIAQGCVSCERTSDPVRFYPIESLKEGHNAIKISGFVVTSGMIFEADIDSNSSPLYTGDPFSLQTNPRGEIITVCHTSDGDGTVEGTVLSREGFEKGKLHVLFN